MTYLILFFEFFKIGLFTFGGGLAMLPLMEEVVLRYDWLTEAQFYQFVGVSESTPGPIAINMATYIGSSQGGWLGSIIATAGVVLPSFIVILLIASILKNFTNNRFFKGFIQGIKPVVTALILSMGVILLMKVVGYSTGLQFQANWTSMIILGAVTAIYWGWKLLFKKKLSAVTIILISAALGVAVCTIL